MLRQPQPASATVTRTGSGLSPPTTQYQSSGSLLKRGSTISGSPDDFQNFAGNTGASGPTLLHTADDSFTDSYFEEVNDANRREMHDLRLQHLSQKANAPIKKTVNGTRAASLGASAVNAPQAVKMVKKYVPTPNGIKVIEVPEATIKKEMARSNSIRSGLNVSRAGSLTLRKSSQGSLNSRVPRSGSMGSVGGYTPSSRVSSLIKQAPPLLPAMTEQSGLEGSTDTQEKEFHDLQIQIEHEKKLAQELAKKKKEYEQYKVQRLQMQRDLEVLREELSSPIESKTDMYSGLQLNTNQADPVLTDSVADHNQQHLDDHYDNIKAATSASLEYTLNPTMDPKSMHIPDGHPGSTDETLQASSDNAHLYIHESPFASRDQLDEIRLIEQYDGSKEENVLEVPDITFDTSSYEDLDNENDHNLKPTFQESPEVIEEPISTQFSNDAVLSDGEHLGAPPHLIPENASTHSLTSGESYESPHRTKKPMKSAMKSSSSLNKAGKDPHYAKAKQTAAHEAYLSLTTAENTRLNSKLSANQLSPTMAMPASPSTTPKRMPLSLRKSQVISQQQQQQQMVKSLRPQSTEPGRYPTPNSAAGPRTLRKQTPHTYVQPMPPHPALMPNYKSPSKIRAAELYEKANLRPTSIQQPLERKSSFTKLPDKSSRPMSLPPGQQGQQIHIPPSLSRVSSQATVQHTAKPAARQPRTTLRTSHAGGPLPVLYGSRLNDSDGEDIPFKSGFSSRFHDSDDDLPARVLPQQEVQDVSFDSKTSKSTAGGKEKKKFGKLRKLFGKH